jgi:hypothetical protein
MPSQLEGTSTLTRASPTTVEAEMWVYELAKPKNTNMTPRHAIRKFKSTKFLSSSYSSIQFACYFKLIAQPTSHPPPAVYAIGPTLAY